MWKCTSAGQFSGLPVTVELYGSWTSKICLTSSRFKSHFAGQQLTPWNTFPGHFCCTGHQNCAVLSKKQTMRPAQQKRPGNLIHGVNCVLLKRTFNLKDILQIKSAPEMYISTLMVELQTAWDRYNFYIIQYKSQFCWISNQQFCSL